MNEPWDNQMEALGDFIRRQRKLANLSLRQLAERTRLSNPYLSQIERGLHQPSMRVIKVISEALNVSAETLLTQAGLLHHADHAGQAGQAGGALPAAPAVERAIESDSRLTGQQKSALISVYRSMLSSDSPEP
ncbi:MAG: helix-turn-helix domain-containing protein [Streptosporangiaceae bacterium]